VVAPKTDSKRLRVRGLPVPPSIMLARIAEDPAVTRHFDEVSFKLWPGAGAMREDLAAGSVDLCVIPTNVSAGLYNDGLPIRLLAVTVWGILHVLTNRAEFRDWPDLKGARIAIPLKGNMPDTIFSSLASKLGLDLEGDAQVVYVDSYIAAKDQLVAGEVDAVVLPEPVATTAEIEGKAAGVRRMLDLQAEWARAHGGPPRFPQAGAVVSADLAGDPEVLDLLLGATERALDWMEREPEEAARLGEPYLGGLAVPVIAQSLRQTSWNMKPPAAARAELETFYRALMASSPDLVKGGLPDEGFYLG
jgi:NitT/TauT family transport system substrate-binding protein